MSAVRGLYSQAERDEAILICAIAASTPGLEQNYRSVCYHLGIDITDRSSVLALRAWAETSLAGIYSPDAEAEALLQTGWSPGDEP